MGAKVTLPVKKVQPKIEEFFLRATQNGVSLDFPPRRESHELFVPAGGGLSGAFKYLYDVLAKILVCHSYQYCAHPSWDVSPVLQSVMPEMEAVDFAAVLTTLSGSTHGTCHHKRLQVAMTLPLQPWHDVPHRVCFVFRHRTAIAMCRTCGKKAERVFVHPCVQRRGNALFVARPDELLAYFFAFTKMHVNIMVPDY